jgi:hypothetical protein
MQEDKFSDFERAEYYKDRLKSNKGLLVVMCVLFFVLGFVVAP